MGGFEMAEIIWKDRKRIFFGLPWTFTKYSLSEDRLFISTGFFSVQEDEVRLYRIMDVSLERKLWQRMCGLGTIKCCSADKTMGDFEIKNIKKSREVKEMLSNMVEDERTKKKVSSREFMDHERDEFDDYDDHDTY
ncbi:PH domain-containing protein [Clostridium sp. OM05-9]|nr:PH domain-containing protein [Clostridium sp. OM05-9]RHV81629.1 PH domain-containing protein [Clostridium sp. OF10-22XD]